MSDTIRTTNLEVECLRIVDKQGKTRAELACYDNDTVMLTFQDGRGRVQMGMGTPGDDPYKPGFVIYHEHGEQRMAVEIDDNGKASIRIYDIHGICRVILAVGADGVSTFGMADSEGKPLMAIGATGEDSVIALSNSQGDRTWSASTENNKKK